VLENATTGTTASKSATSGSMGAESNVGTIDTDTSDTLFEKSIGNYIIKQTLGTGSFSKTKLGIHKQTGEKVAIKILKDNLPKSSLNTIFTEINALKAIKQHPNIVKLLDYD
jgi:serine/threonine protein kinase